MNRRIINPYYTDNTKTIIVAEFHNEDGSVFTASVSNPDDGVNPDWTEIFENFTEEEIEKNTAEFSEKSENRRKLAANFAADSREKEKNEALFQAKIDAFQLEEVKGSKDRTTKSKIRKAKTLVEVYAYTAAIVCKADT